MPEVAQRIGRISPLSLEVLNWPIQHAGDVLQGLK